MIHIFVFPLDYSLPDSRGTRTRTLKPTKTRCTVKLRRITKQNRAEQCDFPVLGSLSAWRDESKNLQPTGWDLHSDLCAVVAWELFPSLGTVVSVTGPLSFTPFINL